ncbi:MAG: exodeoxyribonuclease VII large subunit [Gammaproteobacteria bacterium]|nr:exodeoxyribonuclease VII large subunit [Gammaproteobacteria bacterium]
MIPMYQNHTMEGEYIFSVTELNLAVRDLLEKNFSQVFVSGEISNLTQPASGHLYFTLKDSHGQIKCALFRGKQKQLRFNPQNGQHVTVLATVSLYPERGDYQLLVEHVQLAGEGMLQQRYEALKLKLSEAGLFDSAHKKPFPAFPKCIGVITSKTGAALQDILSVLKRRCPIIPIIVYSCQVQGDLAAPQLIEAIQSANNDPLCDVLILARGGGSIEDLWAFNNEQLAYAIFNSDIPIISAVGHETDFTIADFVADQRAPTPSAAAEIISPNQDELTAQLNRLQLRLNELLHNRLFHAKHHLLQISKRLIHPKQKLYQRMQKLDDLSTVLIKIIHTHLNRRKQDLKWIKNRFEMHKPSIRIHLLDTKIKQWNKRLEQLQLASFKNKRDAFYNAAEKLHTLSPLATLRRGYAIVQNENKVIITQSKQVKVGDEINLTLAAGALNCEIKSIIAG